MNIGRVLFSKSIAMLRHPVPGEPTPAQAESGRYPKRAMKWRGLTIRIENEAGSVRRGKSKSGHEWEVRMTFPYGEFARTEGVDGDPVDVIVGPYLDAPMVYVVHQRRYGDWSNYDEDKCCIGFDSEESAKAAFLSNYDDPRFLGPITAIPVSEFVDKVKATKDAPAMIKALIAAHTRRLKSGKVVNVRAHSDKRTRHEKPSEGQAALLSDEAPAAAGRQTDTPQFKEWFGRSVLTDNDGKPMVMYHATPHDIEAFIPGGNNPKLSGPAIWLSPNKHEQPAAHNIRQVPGKPGFVYGNQSGKYTPGTNVMPLYVRLENAIGSTPASWKEVYSQFDTKGGSPWTMSAEFVAEAKAKGFDGIMHLDSDGTIKEVAVFDAKQVKSAIGNNGDFSKDSPVITKSSGADRRRVLFMKAKSRGDDRTQDMFAGPAVTHVEVRTRKDGHVQKYHVASAKPVAQKKDAAWARRVVDNKDYLPWQDVEEAHKILGIEDEDKKWALETLAQAKAKKDAALDAAISHLKEDSGQKDIPAAEKKEDADLVAKLEEARGITVTSKQKIRDPLEGTHTAVELSNGKTHRIQRLNATESMGLPGWHDVDGGYLADSEKGAIDELIRRAKPAPLVKSIIRTR